MPTSQNLKEFDAFEGRVPAGPAAPAVTVGGASPKASPKSKLQIRKANSKQFAALEVEDDVEAFLEHHPYVKGFAPSKADLELYTTLCHSETPNTPNLRRWFEHIDSFTQ